MSGGKENKMKFTVNGKEYNAVPIEFETICKFEEMGIESEELGTKKTLSTLKAYFAMCAGIPDIVASKEINAHVVAGGNLSELMKVLEDEMEKSDFIKAVQKQTEEAPQTEEVPQTAPQIAEVPQIVPSETKSESTEA